MKLSVAFALAALVGGIASAIEWWRSTNVNVRDKTNASPTTIDPAVPPAPFNPKQTSIGSLRAAAEKSAALNSNAALYSGLGVILSAISSLISSAGY